MLYSAIATANHHQDHHGRTYAAVCQGLAARRRGAAGPLPRAAAAEAKLLLILGCRTVGHMSFPIATSAATAVPLCTAVFFRVSCNSSVA